MNRNQVLAIVLAVALIALFTTSVIGATDWLVFWLFALALFGYTTYAKRKSA